MILEEVFPYRDNCPTTAHEARQSRLSRFAPPKAYLTKASAELTNLTQATNTSVNHGTIQLVEILNNFSLFFYNFFGQKYYR